MDRVYKPSYLWRGLILAGLCLPVALYIGFSRSDNSNLYVMNYVISLPFLILILTGNYQINATKLIITETKIQYFNGFTETELDVSKINGVSFQPYYFLSPAAITTEDSEKLVFPLVLFSSKEKLKNELASLDKHPQ